MNLRRLLRRRPAAPASPFGPPERVRELGAAPTGDDFLTGNGFAAHCRHALNYNGLRTHDRADRDWWFCKADFLEDFLERQAPREPFVLVSHNSDRPIDGRFTRLLDEDRLVAWFAQNVAIEHPKLHAIPIGIANPVWPHGDQAVFRRVQSAPPPKTELLDVAFDTATAPEERRRCLAAVDLAPAPRVPFGAYLCRLAAAYFCLAPSGNGIDTHRLWEALYVGTVPVVTRSAITDQHPDLPLVVLDDWEELRSFDLSPELYQRRWGDFDRTSLRLDAYLRRLDALLTPT